MKLPLSWLREYAPVEVSTEPAEVARRLTAAGLEVESVEPAGHDISGVVVAKVLAIEELAEFKKPILYCRVTTRDDTGDAAVRRTPLTAWTRRPPDAADRRTAPTARTQGPLRTQEPPRTRRPRGRRSPRGRGAAEDIGPVRTPPP